MKPYKVFLRREVEEWKTVIVHAETAEDAETKAAHDPYTDWSEVDRENCTYEEILSVEESPPHADGDFTKRCGNENCRCHQ